MNYLGAEIRGVRGSEIQQMLFVKYRLSDCMSCIMAFPGVYNNPLNPPFMRETYLVSPIKGRLQRGVIHTILNMLLITIKAIIQRMKSKNRYYSTFHALIPRQSLGEFFN